MIKIENIKRKKNIKNIKININKRLYSYILYVVHDNSNINNMIDKNICIFINNIQGFENQLNKYYHV